MFFGVLMCFLFSKFIPFDMFRDVSCNFWVHIAILWIFHDIPIMCPHVGKTKKNGIWARGLSIAFHLSNCDFNESAPLDVSQGAQWLFFQDQNMHPPT